jgi:hypothetical protein
MKILEGKTVVSYEPSMFEQIFDARIQKMVTRAARAG